MEVDAATPASGPAATAVKRSPIQPTFAHASEGEFARILDFYDVHWDYEPHVFPILWNLEGSVVESFSPDFYLPDFDTYLELTTLRQPLVRKKNRKLRRLRELYPDVRIKLLYARDFRALMLKYGKLGLVAALSGTPGQVLPAGIRPIEVEAAGESGELDVLPEDGPSPGETALSPDRSVVPGNTPLLSLDGRNRARSRRRHLAVEPMPTISRDDA